MTENRRRKSNRKPRQQQATSRQEFPGWMWMLFGLGIGLSVALAIYMQDRVPARTAEAARPAPVPVASAIDNNNETAPEPQEVPEQRFAFYDMLPNFEVVIPEQESIVSTETAPVAVEQPGIYVLQAGSFTEYADADRRRAELALQGIESRIQQVSIDDRTYHRVRIGPTRDLDELNMLRSRLRQAKIDAIRIRLGD
jgi:cell division protein FtsN